MTSRRQSREAAFQFLYDRDLKGMVETNSGSTDFSQFAEHFDIPQPARAYADYLACGTLAKLETIDAQLNSLNSDWRLERMDRVDRNILRLGVFEIQEGGTHPTVAIDEAIEISKQYGSERSSAFVNGVLDALAKGKNLPTHPEKTE